jgi:primosomal protein N' (replication factor Y)
LTFHQAIEPDHLQCHHCGYTRQMPGACPRCRSAKIRQYGAGTEKVVAEVERLFPGARVLRWDYETTRSKGAHDVILSHFSAGRADILVGTQMIAKGLDLPLVTLVGIILADVGLALPDYRATERTFQVLTQVAGRAGRSLLGGRVILQTFQPDHYVIQATAGHDYEAFYARELDYRRRLGYPPFADLARLEYRHADPQRAAQAAHELARRLSAELHTSGLRATQMIGPAPCFFSRQAGLYRWQIILRGPDPARWLRARTFPDWRVEVNPPSLL